MYRFPTAFFWFSMRFCKVGMPVAKTEDQTGLAEDALPADINEIDSVSEGESQRDDLGD